MKYISLDIETTGLNSENCQILSVGAVFEDTNNPLSFREIPKFHAIILSDRIEGEPFALNMNRELISLIVQYQTSNDMKKAELSGEHGLFLTRDNFAGQFLYFLTLCGYEYNNTPIKLNIAGKNFGTFDKLFLDKMPRWKQYFKINQRILDPAILFVDFKEDAELPNLDKCKERAGIDGKVSHNALEDAWDVVVTLRTKY